MTSVVAILNNQAVALAADSAVTTSGPYSQKIYNTVNKLFTLSKYQPVGIMVYSSAEVLTIPIETVIKSYRQQRKDAFCLSLQDYADDFLTFLKTESSLFPKKVRIEHANQVIHFNLVQLRDRIMRRLTTDFPNWGEPTRNQVKQAARTLLKEHHQLFHTSNELPNVTPQTRTKLKPQIKDVIDVWKKEFKHTFALSNADVTMLSEIGLDLLLREYRTGIETGFVIAGFGEDEYVPQLRSFELESSVLNVHKVRDGNSVDISRIQAAIVPFAQTEMVETFVQGRESSLDNLLLTLIDHYFTDQKNIVSQNSAARTNIAAIHSLMDTLCTGLRQQFSAELAEFTKKKHIDPVLATVNSMPKEELATMAEALVNLTSIKRRMSPDAETVGGPIDVAVISKGDGFVWIKRKHYFRPELNPGFEYNYFKGG
ncbi:MAG TPA: hypothetical protein VJ183_09965 [Chloroflexia bacterium]|nr:hypothetical protein [Chloroflexia bacterium]